jgi:hypothetical protein
MYLLTGRLDRVGRFGNMVICSTSDGDVLCDRKDTNATQQSHFVDRGWSYELV